MKRSESLFNVSIRALTRRATGCPAGPGCPHKFQFVPSRGGQQERGAGPVGRRSFNSCPHAEGNPPAEWFRNTGSRFNSCPHAEGNPLMYYKFWDSTVSIRALTRRATTPPGEGPRRRGCFNSCPHAEGNLEAVIPRVNLILSFNSCPHAEGNNIRAKPALA